MWIDLLEQRVKSSWPLQAPFSEKVLPSKADFIVAPDGRTFDNGAERARRTDPRYRNIALNEWARQKGAGDSDVWAVVVTIAVLFFLIALLSGLG